MADIIPVRAALIGYGYAGQTFHGPLMRACAELSLDTVITSKKGNDLQNLKGVTTNSQFEAALLSPDIELIVVATPNTLHASQAHAALAAGKHVVVDKPLAVTAIEAEELIKIAEAKGLALSVFHNRRWDSSFLTFAMLKDRLGCLSEVTLRFDRMRPVVQERWRELDLPGSGSWFGQR